MAQSAAARPVWCWVLLVCWICLRLDRSVPMMAGSCVGLGALVGSFQAAGSTLVNGAARPTSSADKVDPDSPLLASTQERRARFFKVRDEHSQRRRCPSRSRR